MALVLALGSNIGDTRQSLQDAISAIDKKFNVVAKSQLYKSPAIEYTNQPDFFNMVIECKSSILSPEETLKTLLQIEKELGRRRDIDKGPRTIDIDILFFDDLSIDTKILEVPHPRLFDRSFVVLPLSELPIFKTLQKSYDFSMEFNNSATPIGAL